MRKLVFALVVGAVTWSACGTEYPAIPDGDRVSGTVHYRGTAMLSMRRPVVRTYATVSFPPVGTPAGATMLTGPDLAARLAGPGVPYEIVWLAPYGYKIIGQIVDLDAPNIDYSALPLGGFPDYCTLRRSAEGLVDVTKDVPTTGVDFAIYDQAGSGDPCTQGVCPQRGKSTMRVTIKSSMQPAKSDRLRVAVFQTLPANSAEMPVSLRILAGAGLVFPQIVTDNTLLPGSYALVDICYDVGGNSGTDRCTDEDVDVAYAPPSPPIVFPADQIVNLTADLDTGTVTLEGVQDPTALGCL